jgi:hypothetical protein
MSALGQKQTCAAQERMSAKCQKRTSAKFYSITSPARASTAGGTVRPRAFAVLRLIASSYLVAACTGSSAGLQAIQRQDIRRAAEKGNKLEPLHVPPENTPSAMPKA